MTSAAKWARTLTRNGWRGSARPAGPLSSIKVTTTQWSAGTAGTSARPRTEQEEGMLRGLETVQKHVIDYYRGWPDKVEIEPYFAVNSKIDGLK